MSTFPALILLCFVPMAGCNDAPLFVHDMDGLRLSPTIQQGTIIYQLVGEDNESEVYYSIVSQTVPGQFQVDRRTGAVSLSQPLSLTGPSVHDVTISLEDLAVDEEGAQRVQKDVKVYVDNTIGTTQPAIPVAQAANILFSVESITSKVAENWLLGVPLPLSDRLYVSSTDPQATLQVTVEPSDLFSVSPELLTGSGYLSVTATSAESLDVETLNALSTMVTVFVSDTQSADSAQMDIVVQLIDVDEYTTQFAVSLYEMQFTDALTQGQVLGAAEIVDRDYTARDKQQLTFELFGEYAKYFQVASSDVDVIEIRYNPCANCLVSDLPVSFDLRLRATDREGRVSETSVRLSKGSGSSQPPVFDRTFYESGLNELSTQFQPLLRVRASSSEGTPVTYALQDSTNLFAIHPTTGIVSVLHPEFVSIDQLGIRFNLTASATDQNGARSEVQLVIQIIEQQNARNEAPQFAQSSYSMSVSPANQRAVGTLKAVDSDGNVTYSIAEGGAGYFALNATSGLLTYIGQLPKEDQTYTLLVNAHDNSTPPKFATSTVQVQVTGIGSEPALIEGDKAIEATINDSASDASAVVLHEFKVTDGDPDSELNFRVEQVVAYDRLGQQWTAPDTQSLTQLNSLVQFSASQVPKDTGTSSLLLDSVTLLNQFPDVLSLHVTVALSDAKHPLEPADQATVIVNVAPKKTVAVTTEQLLTFAQLPNEVKIAAATPVGGFIYKVGIRPIPESSAPESTDVRYSLILGQDWMDIDPKTGVISLAKSLSSSRTPVEQINVTVAVTHVASGATNSARFIVRPEVIRNNPPTFLKERYEATLVENMQSDRVRVTQITADDKDAQTTLTYSLSGDDAQMFTVDSNGVIYAVQSVDREERDRLSLVLTATDDTDRASKVPLTVTVLDVNDHTPVFSQTQYVEAVTENVALNTHLVQVQATDQDFGVNGSIVYSILNVQPDTLRSSLSIDPSKGIIRNTRPLNGLGQASPYQLGIVARDGQGSNSSTVVFLTITSSMQCRPEFTSPRDNNTIISVKENLESGQKIVILKAVINQKSLELDCPIAFVIWDSATKSYVRATDQFALNDNTGELTTLTMFDREQTDRYELIVAVQSGPVYTQLALEIRITDDNDNAPSFSQQTVSYELAENSKVGMIVATLTAVDPDLDDGGLVFYHLLSENVPFQLDSVTGALSVASSVDYETQASYDVYVMASNQAAAPNQPASIIDQAQTRTDVMQLNIVVTDVNDNAPSFSQPIYLTAAAKNVTPGQVVLVLQATDKDNTDASVEYSIEDTVYYYEHLNSPAPGMLSINPAGGQLIMKAPVTEYEGGVFHVQVATWDRTGAAQPTQTDSTLVKVFVFDPDEQLVRIVLNERAENVDRQRSERIVKAIGSAANKTGILQDVTFHTGSDGLTDTDHVDLMAIFVDEQDQIVDASKVLKAVDTSANQFLLKGINVEMILAADEPTYQSSTLLSQFSVAAVALIVFAAVLLIGLCCFMLLCCYHRYNWMNRKRRMAKVSSNKVKAAQKAKAAQLQAMEVYRPQMTPNGTTTRSNPMWQQPPGTYSTKCYEAQEFSMDVFGTVRSAAPNIHGATPIYFGNNGSVSAVYDEPADDRPMTEFRPGDLDRQYSNVHKPTRQRSAESGWYDTIASRSKYD